MTDRIERKVDLSEKKLTPIEQKLLDQVVLGISKWPLDEMLNFIAKKKDFEAKIYADITNGSASGEKFLDVKLKKVINKNVHIGEVRFPYDVVKKIILEHINKK